LIIVSSNQGPNDQKSTREPDDLVNELIRFPEVLVINQDGVSLGIRSRREALALAEEANLDLLCVAPQARPAVCKIVNYGKYRFEQQKKAREAKKNQKVVETKEVRFTPQIDVHDMEVKAKATKEWLADGNKVKVTVRFRGRQMTHTELGEEAMSRFLEMIADVGVPEKKAILEGKQLFTTINPKKA